MAQSMGRNDLTTLCLGLGLYLPHAVLYTLNLRAGLLRSRWAVHGQKHLTRGGI